MKKNSDSIAFKNTMKDLQKEYLVIGKTRVNPWEAWLVITLSVGIFFGIVTYAQMSPQFVIQCDYGTGNCGGLWTHSVVHGQIGNIVSPFSDIFVVASDQVATAIGLMPGFFLFMLGFISSALIFGLVWDKFTVFEEKKKVRKLKLSRSRGFISREFIGMFFLAILMVLIVSSPVSSSEGKNFRAKSRSTFSLASVLNGQFALENNLLEAEQAKPIKSTTVRQNIKEVREATAPSSRFSIGERVIVVARVFNIRADADGKILRTGKYGMVGSIAQGPVMRGRIWWKIDFENGASGWVAESFMKKIDGKGDNLFPVSGTTTDVRINKATTSSDVLTPISEARRRWMASNPGIFRVNIDDVNRITSIRKNGIEIWNRENHSRADLKMEFLVSTDDTVDFDLAKDEIFAPQIEIAPIANN